MAGLRGERGATTSEYVGLVVTIAVLFAAVIVNDPAGLGRAVQSGLEAAFCRVLEGVEGGRCSPGSHDDEQGQVADAVYRPESCEVYLRDTVDRGSVRVAFVHLGGDYLFGRTEDSDGETTVTFIDGTQVGVTVGAGGRLEVSSNGATYGGGVQADAKVYGGLNSGDTWVFDSPEEADRFEGWLRREKTEDRRSDLSGGLYSLINGPIEFLTGEEDPPDPDITSSEAGGQIEGSARAWAGVGSAGLEGSAASFLLKQTDHRTGHQTDYYKAALSGSGDLGVLTARGSYGRSGEGVVKVTRDEAGEITRLEIIDTWQRSLGSVAALETEAMTVAELMESLANEASVGIARDRVSQHSTVVETSIRPRDERERAVLEAWTGVLNGFTTAGDRAVGGTIIDSREQVTSAFSDLLYERGRVSVVDYEGQTSGLGLAAEIALGARLGLDIGTSSTDARAVTAYYLGAPDEGRRVLVPYPNCTAS